MGTVAAFDSHTYQNLGVGHPAEPFRMERMSEIDLEALGRAIARLEEALAAYRDDPADLLVRDAVIKRFEFTYELSQSTMRRFVETYSVHLKSRERVTLPTLVRTASEDGILRSGWDVWEEFREARNRTSHTYNEDQAVQVLAKVPAFLDEAKFLYGRMLEEIPR